MNEFAIRAENLFKTYRLQNNKLLHAVDGVSLSIHKGEIFGVVGESGCGKSTLGRCLLRLTDLTAGSVTFIGDDISRLGKQRLKPYRQKMQMIFQNPFSSFDPKQTIGRAFQEAATVHRIPSSDTEQRIAEMLETIKLSAELLTRRPSELSGGQLQRFAIARALLLKPEVILADEPVSALDVSVQAQILNLLLDLQEKYGIAMAFISHDLTVVEHICDTIAVLYLGKIVEQAPTSLLFQNPRHPYTKSLIQAKPKWNRDKSSPVHVLHGDLPSPIDLPSGCRFCSRCPAFQKGLCDKEEPGLQAVEPNHCVACHLLNL